MRQKSRISDISSAEIKVPPGFIENGIEAKQSDKKKKACKSSEDKGTSFGKLVIYHFYESF